MKQSTRHWIEFLGVASFMFVIGVGAYAFANLGVFNNFDNIINIFRGLEWFVGSFALATLFTSYLVVVADMRFAFRFLAIPAWLGFSFALLVALDQFMGYTYPALPPQGELLSYRVIRDPVTNQRIVEAWMYLRKENRTRAYRFDFERNQEEALYRAMRKKARGEAVEVKLIEEDQNGKKDKPDPEDMLKYNIPENQLPEKDYSGGEMQTDNVQQGSGGISDMGSERRHDPIIIKLPGGGNIEVEPGTSFTITPEGEFEIIDPASNKKKQIKESVPTSGPG